MIDRLKYYQCIKQVHAEPMTFGHFLTLRSISKAGNMDPLANGYHVIYGKDTADEDHSWSPKAVFEEGYLEIPDGTVMPKARPGAKVS